MTEAAVPYLTGGLPATIIMVAMARKQPFALIFDAEVRRHLHAIEAKYHGLIRSTIEEELLFEPERQTRNRKPLEPPAVLGATWELRFGPDNRFRVLYAVDPERREVQILAVGVKERNRLFVAGEEMKL
jgi:mRNA-degrading endonuclease RelE of RelBE toxin-antitoxin system